ncbi:MAG: LuxR C-terminal-related transcriptional regulator [Firmicutes bacterium]|nr:LuxR C-terminal-related transcriptional regulator [Bacillota bacterium]
MKEKLGIVAERLVGGAALIAEVQSGRRRYLCRGYRLESGRGCSEPSTVALQFERVCRPILDVRAAAERYRLSPRERQTLALVVQGLSNKEIAAQMGVSPNTVKTFLRLIMGKMGVSSRVGLIRKTIQILAG